LLTLHDDSILALQNKGKLHLVQQAIEETQQNAESGLMVECFL
jgi:hypothetical protein